MWKVIELFFVNHTTAITGIAAIFDIFAVIATISIAFLTYQNIRESRRATIMAQEKKNVIDACKYAIKLISVVEKFAQQLPINFSEARPHAAVEMFHRGQNKEFQEELSKINEQFNNKNTELLTVLGFLPEDGKNQIDWLKSYYKNLKSYSRSSKLSSVGDNLSTLESKLKEKGLADSKIVYESMQNYFHENIKKIIADERFSLYNLARIWIPYEKFKVAEESIKL